MEKPLVSIVTPSLNMGGFIEQTLLSVLEQDYPRIEYIVMDGGSTDNTLSILEKYKDRLRMVSQPDGGTTDAVNRGFLLSRGSIFAFLNADDTYLPGAVSTAVRCLLERPDIGVVYGEGFHTDCAGRVVGRYPTLPFDPERFRTQCYICQPAAFMRREVYEESGMMDPALHFAIDYDLWIRVARRYRMLKIDEYLATSRIHGGSKTVKDLEPVYKGAFHVLKKHYDYIPCNWLFGYCHYLLTGKDTVFAAPRPNPLNAGLTLLVGSWYNRRHLLRYWKDMAAAGLSVLKGAHA